MESTVPGGFICELVNGIVVVGVGGVAGCVVTSFEVANFVVGIGKSNGTTPGFGEEVVVDVVAKGAGTVVTILNRFDSVQSVVAGDGGFTTWICGFGLSVDEVIVVCGNIATGVLDRFNVAKSIVCGELNEDVVGVDYFGLTVESVVVVGGGVVVCVGAGADVSGLVVGGFGAMVGGIDCFDSASEFVVFIFGGTRICPGKVFGGFGGVAKLVVCCLGDDSFGIGNFGTPI
jgi:hypothetical protein